MDMAAERSRDGLTGVRDEENRLGWPPIASALENESMRRWRLLDGPVCARSPLDFGAKSWDSAADHPPFRRANHRHPLATAGRSPVSIETVCCFGLCGCTARQPHREHGALARLARHRHVTRHHARELAGDGKAEPRAAEALGGRGIGLAELLEQLGLLLRSHANAGVSD